MSGKEGDVVKYGRKNRLIKERGHDPYLAKGKLIEPTVCSECKVVFQGGRWQWKTSIPEGANRALCPACQRIHDKVPAGYLTLSGDFFFDHRDEIIRLIHNKVEEQNLQRPLKRLIEINEQDTGGIIITFTDMHLPREVGEAIEKAYQGDLDIQYTDEANILRVYWRR